MLTSPNDNNNYQFITLNNQLRVLLISTPDAENASAALAVEVGHFNDPDDRQGMAHFLEHMLFLGTEKYPDGGEYHQFINRHGGSHNAWTGPEHTNFFFSIENDYLAPALSRFSQFFICPTFNSDLIDKEREAIDSEYRLKLLDDMRRTNEVYKSICNPRHPFAKFSVGSKTTLEDRPAQSIRQDLIDFYTNEYCAGKMALVLHGAGELDELQQLAEKYFSDIPYHGRPISYPDVPMYLPEQHNVKLSVVPHKDLKKLILSFPLPKVPSWYKTKPLSLIAHLIGYEGAGSLLSQLKNEGLVNSLSAGTGSSGYNFSEFTISTHLTEQGLAQQDRIIKLIFEYIQLIKKEGCELWRYQEKQRINQAAFQYQEAAKSIDLVAHLAINIFRYPPQDILFGSYRMDTFDGDLVNSCLGKMSVDNLRLTLVSKQAQAEQHTRWYNTPYLMTPISEADKQRWSSSERTLSMHLPLANSYIPEHLTVKSLETEDQPARVLIAHDGLRLWYKQDHQFRVPKGHVYAAIDSPAANTSPRHVALTRLYIELLHDDLAEMTYPAEIAGLHYDIYAHQAGVTLHLCGYSPKMFQYFEMLIAQIRLRNFAEPRFSEIKHQMIRGWQNAAKARPINRLFENLGVAVQPKQYESEQLAVQMADVTLEELHQHISELFAEVHLEALVNGDWHEHEVLQFGASLQHHISQIAKPREQLPREVIQVNQQGTLIRELDSQHHDSAVIFYLQSPQANDRQTALFSLLNHIMSASFFNEIRTRQQLGYMSGTAYYPINRHPGMILYIQSPVAGPAKLITAIETFFEDFQKLLENMDKEDWQHSLQGILTQILEPDANLRMSSQRLWVSIGSKDYDFNHRQLIADAIVKLTPADLQQFISQQLEQPERLLMCSHGKAHADGERITQGHVINKLTDFKQHAQKYVL